MFSCLSKFQIFCWLKIHTFFFYNIFLFFLVLVIVFLEYLIYIFFISSLVGLLTQLTSSPINQLELCLRLKNIWNFFGKYMVFRDSFVFAAMVSKRSHLKIFFRTVLYCFSFFPNSFKDFKVVNLLFFNIFPL